MSQYQRYIQKFYTKKTALELELSENGIFVTLAPAKGTNENGNTTFDWDSKLLAKASISEIVAISDFIKIFREGGQDLFTKECQKFFGNQKYRNLLFIHDISKRNSDKKGYLKFGLNGGSMLSFLLERSGAKITHPLFSSEIGRCQRFLDFIVQKSFMMEGRN